MKNINPTQTAAWQALQKHFDEMKDVTIADLFAKDSDRFSKFSATFDDQMLVDYSKTASLKRRWRNYKIWRKSAIWRARLSRCSLARRSTALKTAPYCT